MYELTRLNKKYVTRVIKPCGLRLAGGVGTLSSICLPSESVDPYQGLGQIRRCGVATSTTHEFDPILGWTPGTSDLLSGNIIYTGDGSSLRLLTPPFDNRTPQIDGDERRDISMLIRVAKSNSQYEELNEKLSNLTAACATHYLHYTFSAGDEEIEMDGVRSTPTQLMGELPYLSKASASAVAPISFWGGPPGKMAWYDGSLLTMLVDKIMRAVDAGNTGLLNRFMSL